MNLLRDILVGAVLCLSMLLLAILLAANVNEVFNPASSQLFEAGRSGAWDPTLALASAVVLSWLQVAALAFVAAAPPAIVAALIPSLRPNVAAAVCGVLVLCLPLATRGWVLYAPLKGINFGGALYMGLVCALALFVWHSAFRRIWRSANKRVQPTSENARG